MEEIVKVIRVDTKGSNKSISQLKKEIKDLKAQLESTAVGSAEFSATLEALGKAQQQYSDIALDVAARTQNLEKSFQQIGQFSGSVAKGFSAVNAAFGLLGDQSEDVNKALLKVARVMQLIQGLPGLGQAFGQLPKVVANFKNWADQLLPINKRVNDIAESINNLDAKSLQTLDNIANGGGINVSVKAEAEVPQGVDKVIAATNAALGEQQRTIVPVNEEWEKYVTKVNKVTAEQEALKEGLSEAQEVVKNWKEPLERVGDIFEQYSKKTTKAKVDMNAFKEALSKVDAGDIDGITKWINEVDLTDLESLNEVLKDNDMTLLSFSESLTKMRAQLNEDKVAVDSYKTSLEALNEVQNKLEKYKGSSVWQSAVADLEGYKEDLNSLYDTLEKYNDKLVLGARWDGSKFVAPAKVDLEELSSAIDAFLEGAPERLSNLLEDLELDEDALRAVSKDLGVSWTDLADSLTDTADKVKVSTNALKKTEEAIDSVSNSSKGASGAVKKLGSAFKALSGSVIWTVAITAAVAALMKLIGKWRETIKVTQEAKRAEKELSLEVNKGTSGAAKQVIVLRELSRSYKALGDSVKDKKKFLEDYADKIKETGLAVFDVNSAEDVFVKNTDKYVEALKSRAKAEAAQQLAIKKYEEYLEKKAETEQKLEESKDKKSVAERNVVAANGSQATAGYAAQVVAADRAISKAEEDLEKMNGEIEKTLDNLFDVIETNNTAANKVLSPLEKAKKAAEDAAKASAEAASKAKKKAEDEVKFEAGILKGFEEELAKIREAGRDAKEKEIEDTELYYDHLFVLAAKYGEDTKELEEARIKALKEIEDKYRTNESDKLGKEFEDKIKRYQDAIERVRKMKVTSNLKEPKEQTYQTTYKPVLQKVFAPTGGLSNEEADKYLTEEQPKVKAKKGSYIATYQSAEDIKKEYEAQIEYNNKLLDLTKSRVKEENSLLKDQRDEVDKSEKERLKVLGVTAEQLKAIEKKDIKDLTPIEQQALEIAEEAAKRRLEIDTTLAENQIALSDAVQENEEKNLEAYKAVQDKKREALQASLTVASEVFGSMASLAQSAMNAEIETEGRSADEIEAAQEKKKKAANTYAGLSIAQATVDTYKAANEAYSSMASIPYVGPVLGAAAAGAAIVSGLANVKQIIQTAQQAKLSVSGSVSTSGSAVEAPQPINTPPVAYTRNLLGDKETEQLNDPIKCYVLESEMTSLQSKVKVKEQNSRF